MDSLAVQVPDISTEWTGPQALDLFSTRLWLPSCDVFACYTDCDKDKICKGPILSSKAMIDLASFKSLCKFLVAGMLLETDRPEAILIDS